MHSVCDDFTIFKQLFPYDMTCCFQDVVIDVIDVNSGLSPMIYIRNQMVYPWNEEIISLAIFNFGKKKNKTKKQTCQQLHWKEAARPCIQRVRLATAAFPGDSNWPLRPDLFSVVPCSNYTLFNKNVFNFFFRSRLNTLIFLPILGWKFLVFLLSYSLSLFRFRMYSSLPLIAWA